MVVQLVSTFEDKFILARLRLRAIIQLGTWMGRIGMLRGVLPEPKGRLLL